MSFILPILALFFSFHVFYYSKIWSVLIKKAVYSVWLSDFCMFLILPHAPYVPLLFLLVVFLAGRLGLRPRWSGLIFLPQYITFPCSDHGSLRSGCPLTQRGFLSNSQTNASLWIASRLFSLPWHVLVKALKGQWHLQYFPCCKTLFGMMISVNQRTHHNLVSCLPRHHCKAS